MIGNTQGRLRILQEINYATSFVPDFTLLYHIQLTNALIGIHIPAHSEGQEGIPHPSINGLKIHVDGCYLGMKHNILHFMKFMFKNYVLDAYFIYVQWH